MHLFSRFLSYGLSKLWLLGIVVIITVALFVSVLRVSLPYLNQYNSQFSRFLLQHYQIDLAISHIEGRWRDGGPELIIDNLTFNNLDSLGVNFSARKIKAHLDFKRSLLSLSPRFVLIEINSSELIISQLNESDADSSDPISLLFNVAQDVVINDLSFKLNTLKNNNINFIEIANLHWLNSAVRHQLRLTMASKGAEKLVPLSLLADFYGESLDNISGRFYAKALDWQWLDDLQLLLPPLNATANASANFELWADFSNSTIDSVVLALGDNQLTWSVADNKQGLSVAKGNLQWLPFQAGWLIEAKHLSVSSNGQPWPEFEFFVSQQQGLLAGEIEQLPLANVLALRGLFPGLSPQTEQLLTLLQPQATLTGLKLWQENEQWNYRGLVNNYSQHRAGGIPQLSNLNARISGNDNAGSAKILIAKQSLDFGPYFIEPIEIEPFNSTIQWQLDGQRWWIFGEDFNIETADIDSQLNWQLAFDGDQPPVLSLYGDAQLFAAKNTRHYLPHGILSEGLIDYLGSAIKGGYSDEVQILWQGALANFPYQDNSGVFQVNARMEQASFKFDSDWLPLSDAVLDLQFKNEAMVITSKEGRVKNLELSQLSAVIPNLMQDPTLDIDLIVVDNIKPIKELIDDSPLKDNVGNVLTQLDISGKVAVNLNINIPLDDSHPVVKGQVELGNNNVYIPSLDLALEQVSGNINFINSEISGEELTALMFEQPIKLNIVTQPFGSDYGVEIDLAAKWHSNDIPQIWHSYLDDYLAGTLDWLGKITLKITDEDISYHANFKSPMTGIALKLPRPLNKYVNQQEILTVSASGNINNGQFNLALGSRAEILAEFELADTGLEVSNMALLVGRRFNDHDLIVPNDMSLQVDLTTLKIDEWQTFINNLAQGQSSNEFLPPLQNISFFVEKLSLFGQNLSNVSLYGFKNQDSWQIDIVSDQAKGIVKLYDDQSEQGIVADFEYLKLAKQQAVLSKATTKANLQGIPKLSFSCQQCKIGDYDLGKITFNTVSSEQGLIIEQLSLEALSTSLLMSGLWGADELGEFTKITGTFNSDNVVESLKLLNFSSSIRDSNAKVSFGLEWRGSVYAPILATVSGQLDWNLGEGHIAEISDQGLRIFSLFSLDSLRRKLVLDFRDVFVEGVFFNSFGGHFDIDQGIAVTHSSHMDGIAGDLEVVGSINLANTNLDYYLTFTPKLFSNIPVVAGVMTSTPQAFVLAFALTKALGPIIDVVSQVNFKLTGNVAEPEFLEVNRKRKKYKVPKHMLTKSPAAAPLTQAGGRE